jgi:hypothetical protein
LAPLPEPLNELLLSGRREMMGVIAPVTGKNGLKPPLLLDPGKPLPALHDSPHPLKQQLCPCGHVECDVHSFMHCVNDAP